MSPWYKLPHTDRLMWRPSSSCLEEVRALDVATMDDAEPASIPTGAEGKEPEADQG